MVINSLQSMKVVILKVSGIKLVEYGIIVHANVMQCDTIREQDILMEFIYRNGLSGNTSSANN